MTFLKRFYNYFSLTELLLWSFSMLFIVISFLIFDRANYLTLFASLVGVTSLIFNAKGNPFGQVLMIAFSSVYGAISFKCSYYGEMVTYIGMTLPMAVLALVSWLKNPCGNNKAEVKINRIKFKEIIFMLMLTALMTVAFYFILKSFGTANLLTSTLSVATSFSAAYLTFRRSSYFALAYALNDVVLIVLWLLASVRDISYLSVIICFIAFLVNDVYGFVNWQRMYKNQNK